MKLIPIVHYGRCGSTVIYELLREMPGILHLSEYLTVAAGLSLFPVSRGFLNRSDQALNSPATVVDALMKDISWYQENSKTDLQLVFFEIKHWDLARGMLSCDLPTFIKVLNNRFDTPHVVHLYRRNLLRLFLSHRNAQKSGIYHTREVLPATKQMVDAAEFLASAIGWATTLVRHTQQLNEFDSIGISYEAYVAEDPRVAVREIMQYIPELMAGANALPKVNITLKRTNPYPLHDLVTNLQEIVDCLTRVGAASILSDEIGPRPSEVSYPRDVEIMQEFLASAKQPVKN